MLAAVEITPTTRKDGRNSGQSLVGNESSRSPERIHLVPRSSATQTRQLSRALINGTRNGPATGSLAGARVSVVAAMLLFLIFKAADAGILTRIPMKRLLLQGRDIDVR